eukprot:TRINITY_DN4159_c0_g1_i2.p1 TRINITY_DN4159_c0_g1~~TRINITY_DN4159_c0_g1_i2.p1  ORF type:complete len:749 (-),score=146.54 TRINITY_DN4159_c0_g1_i2:281-2527(-)
MPLATRSAGLFVFTALLLLLSAVNLTAAVCTATERAAGTRQVVSRLAGADTVLNLNNNEPTVAVDPNNPSHVVVATYLSVRVSTDGGVTFQPSVSIAAPAGYSTGSGGDSSLGYDSTGRLFYTFLLNKAAVGGFDVFVAQLNPSTGAVLAGYPINLSAGAGVPDDNANHSHDKSWLAVDSFPGSPYRDNLYVVWTDFSSSGTQILTSSSSNQGVTWSPAITLSGAGEGFVWPSENTVAPNGYVFAAYHSQPTFSSNNPDGTSGQILMLRSVDGGATYALKSVVYSSGQADITFNKQSGTRIIPNTQFWLQGSVQPRVLADPLTLGRIYVVANDQVVSTDFADVFIVVSTDHGATWSSPTQISGGTAGSIQVMPQAAIDRDTGCLFVSYYDNRNGAKNAGGNFLLDVFATHSSDGGATFSPEVQINAAAFDPDLNAPCRFGPAGCGGVDTVNTLRIGEYNGVAMGAGVAHQVWTGNDGGFQDTFYTKVPGCGSCSLTCQDVSVSNDPGYCGAAVSYQPSSSGGCGPVTCTPASGSFFPIGVTAVTCTSATGSECTFNVEVVDAEPPTIYCPADLTVDNDPGKCSALVSGFAASASDNCPGVTSSCSPPPGTVFPKGDTTVTCTAQDASGNTASCSFNITVVDVEAPVVSCDVALHELWPPEHDLVSVGLAASADDNCDGQLPVIIGSSATRTTRSCAAEASSSRQTPKTLQTSRCGFVRNAALGPTAASTSSLPAPRTALATWASRAAQ